MSPDTPGETAETLSLTTTGRRSGRPREIEIWFTAWGERVYVIAEERERAQWVQNIRADPRVRWRVGARVASGRARVLEGAAAAAVQARSAAKYGWGDGLVVELVADAAPVDQPRVTARP
jgi:deazaflavin-dependent oxidoreductase (nitroreductase family)